MRTAMSERPSRVRRGALSLGLAASTLLCASCDGEGSTGITHSVVLAEVALVANAAEDGSVVGLNLDDRVDDMPAPETCNKVDFTDPNGVPGIDNQLSLFGPTLSLFGGDPAALIQGAINEGSLLILLEFEGIDSFDNDDDVTVRLHFGEGPTDVGNDGLLVPGQSFDIKEGTASVEMRRQRIVDGHMDASSFETVLPVAVLAQRFNLPIFAGRLSIDFDADTGEVTGTLGGAVPVQTLIDDLLATVQVHTLSAFDYLSS